MAVFFGLFFNCKKKIILTIMKSQKLLSIIKTIFLNCNFLVFILYIFIYTIFFIPILKGVGNFWDWTFPYFKDQLPNFFLNQSLSWTNLNFGSPLGYSSDYFFRFLIYLFSFLKLNPELLLYFIILFLFSAGSLGVFLISKKRLNIGWSFIFGLVAFINPAIFYKLLAGHIDYFVSYVVFIYFVYYLLFKFQKTFKSAIILGLVFAFIGVQIQLFIFTLLFLVLYLGFNREKFCLKYFFVICLIPFLINIFWLTNFLLTTGLQKAGETASLGVFSGLNTLKIINIFNFSFSRLTFIDIFYSIYEKSFFILFYVFLVIYCLKNKIRDKNNLFLFSFLLLTMILSTGFLNNIHIFPIGIISLLLREVGHFAPLIILTLVLLVILVKKRHYFIDIFFSVFLMLFLIINFYTFNQSFLKLNFNDVRNQFSSFYQFNNKNNSSYRILTYPFFSQYSFNKITVKEKNGYLINNIGWDSFIIFSGLDSVSNEIKSEQLKDSVQYKLLKDYDINDLKKYNVKYIYNFSNIYESNHNRYVLPSDYDNDLSLIKNDKEFFNKLIAKNPNKLIRINDQILEIKDSLPIVYSKNLFFEKINSTKYKIILHNLKQSQVLDYFESFHNGWSLYLEKNPTDSLCKKSQEYNTVTECKQDQKFFEGEELSYLYKKKIFDDTHKIVDDYANQWTIDSTYIKQNFDKSYYTENPDGSINIELTLYFKPQSYFYLGLIISATTLLGCFGYLGWDFVKRRKREEDEVIDNRL